MAIRLDNLLRQQWPGRPQTELRIQEEYLNPRKKRLESMQTIPITLLVGLFHTKELSLYVVSSPIICQLHHPRLPLVAAPQFTDVLERARMNPLVTLLREPLFQEPCLTPLPCHFQWKSNKLRNLNLSLKAGYHLSFPESKAMEDYIEKPIAMGYIRPSTSPAAT